MKTKRHSSEKPKATRPSAVKTVLALLFALVLTFSGMGCGSEAPADTSNTSSGTMQVAMSDLSRLVPTAPQEDVTAVASSLQAFGVDLYRILAADADGGNLVFSPSSIATALAMTYAGASGITAQEMAETLHFALQGDALHAGFNSLDHTLESRSFQQKDHEGKEVGVLIKTANSLWGQRDTAFEKLFLDSLATHYGAGIRLVDYKQAAEEARQAINHWVAEQTEDKIPELLPQGTLDELVRLVLVNAIYLDATWESQFDPSLTKDGEFKTLAGETVTAALMRQTASYRYAAGDGWQAVQLPYLGGEVAMLLIVPDEGGFAEVEAQLSASESADSLLDQVVEALGPEQEVALVLPQFEFRTQAGLRGALQALGMRTAFDAESADFSAMSTEEPLYISDVVHEAYIAVDEEGTEAAAATAVVMRAAGLPAQPVELIIDRPFIFALRDLDTGALLFLGRVTDPTK